MRLGLINHTIFLRSRSFTTIETSGPADTLSEKSPFFGKALPDLVGHPPRHDVFRLSVHHRIHIEVRGRVRGKSYNQIPDGQPQPVSGKCSGQTAAALIRHLYGRIEQKGRQFLSTFHHPGQLLGHRGEFDQLIVQSAFREAASLMLCLKVRRSGITGKSLWRLVPLQDSNLRHQG